MSQPTLRRSPRIAAKGGAEPVAKAGTAEPVAKSGAAEPEVKTPMTTTQVPPPNPWPSRPLTEDEKAHDLTLWTSLLKEATEFLPVLEKARTREQFTACVNRADSLWNASRAIISPSMDSFFISDCMHYCIRARKMDDPEHRCAVKSIVAYISCLRENVNGPPQTIPVSLDTL